MSGETLLFDNIPKSLKGGVLRLFSRSFGSELSAELRRYRENGELKRLLESIIRDKQMLAHVHSRSYAHVNGFVKIALLANGARERELRLHIWQPGDGSYADRHNHPWDFCSLTLAGELATDIFVERSGTSFKRTTIAPVGGGQDGYTYIDDGCANLEKVLSFMTPSQGAYHMNHSLIHNAYSPKGAATLMLQGPFVRETTVAYRRRNIKHARPEPLRKINVRALRGQLEAVVEAMESGAAGLA